MEDLELEATLGSSNSAPSFCRWEDQGWKKWGGTCSDHTGWREAEQGQRFQCADSQAHIFSLYVLILILQSLHFKNPSLYGHTHWKEFCFTMAGRASSGMYPNQEEAIPLVFFWMSHSGWCMVGVEVWKAGKFCSSKFFILSYPKHITVVDFLVKPEPKRVKMELVTGEGMPNWAQTNTAYLHSTSVAILFSHTRKVNTWCKLNGWTVLSVWQVYMCPPICESTV